MSPIPDRITERIEARAQFEPEHGRNLCDLDEGDSVDLYEVFESYECGLRAPELEGESALTEIERLASDYEF
jgi:hypothetical protein